MECTHALALPLLDIEEYVITTFRSSAKTLGNHHIILRQPKLQLLMITPITAVPRIQLDLYDSMHLGIVTHSS
jgi:hypothetical protein